ncbi:MAG: NBR1-Ig-like domain-containing protein [Anaerolineae bacterium]
MLRTVRFFLDFGWLATLMAVSLALSACAPQVTPTLYLPPSPLPLPPTASPAPVFSPTPSPLPSLTPSETPSPLPTPCTNDLKFLEDLTFPDGSLVAPGSSIDKQWLVLNSGSCNWDSRYRLKFLRGDPLSAPSEQALYPARAGSQAVLRILFTAPLVPGTYGSEWQAVDPQGQWFGESVYLQIVVGP